MSNLYQIEADYLALMYELEDNGGELTPELGLRLEIVKEDFDRKVLAYSKMIVNLEGDVTAAASEMERIGKYLITKGKMIDRLKENLLGALKLFGIRDPKKDIWRYEIGTFKMSTRKSISTEITDFESIPDEYKEAVISISNLPMEERDRIVNILQQSAINYNTETKPLKSEIKEAIQAGGTVEGAELKTNYSLNLR